MASICLEVFAKKRAKVCLFESSRASGSSGKTVIVLRGSFKKFVA